MTSQSSEKKALHVWLWKRGWVGRGSRWWHPVLEERMVTLGHAAWAARKGIPRQRIRAAVLRMFRAEIRVKEQRLWEDVYWGLTDEPWAAPTVASMEPGESDRYVFPVD